MLRDAAIQATVEAGQTLEFSYSGENFEFKVGHGVLMYAVNAQGPIPTACNSHEGRCGCRQELDELQSFLLPGDPIGR